MRLLSIETSCEHASVCLLVDGTLVSHELQGHANHSERLLPLIRHILGEAGLAPSALDAVAFGAGPGAFTGLRLACGVAQGLAMGAGIGVMPVGSLAALALQAGPGRVLAVTDARMGELYAAGFEVDGDMAHEILPPVCVPPQLLEVEGQWRVVGSALKAWPDLLPQESPEVLAREPALVPRAAEVARLAAARLRAGEAALAPELAVPLYVRDKVALTTDERLARGGKA